MVEQLSTPRPIQKAFLNYKNEAVVSCPNCYRTHNAFATALAEHLNDVIQIDCPCGLQFGIELDSRRSYRKKVCISGMCIDLEAGKSWDMVIVDMSISGAGIKIEQQTALRIGQRIEVKFDLNDGKREEISKTAVVKRVDNQFIGVEFTDMDAHFEALADYIHATELQ